MRETKDIFLNRSLPPARMSSDQTAWHLGFEPHEIPILINAGLLKPLGHPAANSTKYFSAGALEVLRHDEKWLSKASDAIAIFWRKKNAQKKAALRDQPHEPMPLNHAG
jgi:hypothetical protein